VGALASAEEELRHHDTCVLAALDHDGVSGMYDSDGGRTNGEGTSNAGDWDGHAQPSIGRGAIGEEHGATSNEHAVREEGGVARRSRHEWMFVGRTSGCASSGYICFLRESK
jgi:hypothetical protein